MNPSTIPAAAPVSYADRTAARLDAGKAYRVKRGARTHNGTATTRFAPGERVLLGGDGRPDGDGDLFVYGVRPDGSRNRQKTGYVWAVDLYEDVPTPAPYTGPTADDFAAAMEALGVDEATRGTVAKVAEAIAGARA